MGTFLVTGAAGFIGSAIATRLISVGHDVWTIDNLSTGYEANIPDGVFFIRGNCQDPKSIEQLAGTRFDAILHIAGQSSGEISFDDPVYDLRTNTESTLLLIEYALKNHCPRFVYASSMSVYGEVKDRPIPETHKCAPLSFYGVGKLASENYLRIYSLKGLEYTALRYFNVYGPGQNMQNLRQGMVSIFLEQLLHHDQIVVKGPLHRFRDFLYIDDCVDFTIRLINEPKAFRQIYNVGTGCRTDVDQLLKTMLRLHGQKKEIIVDDIGTPGDQNGIYADMTFVNKQLGWNNKYDLNSGLEKMIKWAYKQS